MKIVILIVSVLTALNFPTLAQLKPGPENTGWTGTLTSHPGGQITAPNTIIENRIINRTLTFVTGADNCIVRNCKIKVGSPYGINVSGAKNLIIENCEISGMSSAGILGSNWSLYHSEIHNSGADGLKPSYNVHIEGNWIYNCGYKPDSHADGLQMVKGSNITIIRNNYDMGPSSGFKNSSNLMIQTNNAVINNVLIEGNWFAGGAYTININDKNRGYGPPSGIFLINNIFENNSQYGPWVFQGATRDSHTIYGNKWADSLSLIPNQKDQGKPISRSDTIPLSPTTLNVDQQ